MEEYTIKIMNHLEDINTIEQLRKEVFHLKQNATNYYEFHILHNQMIPYGMFYNNQLIAGCYISKSFDSIYVNFLFVKEEYRHNGLKIGRKLLLYILEHKKEIEEFFGQEFTISKLHPNNQESRRIYQTIGYNTTNNSNIMTKKI